MAGVSIDILLSNISKTSILGVKPMISNVRKLGWSLCARTIAPCLSANLSTYRRHDETVNRFKASPW